jgi:hypothetical protein
LRGATAVVQDDIGFVHREPEAVVVVHIPKEVACGGAGYLLRVLEECLRAAPSYLSQPIC